LSACPLLESLEARTVMAITFQFVYVQNAATTAFLAANPEAKADLQQSGDTLGSQINNTLSAINPGGSNTWSALIPNPDSSDPLRAKLVEHRDLVVPEDTMVVYVSAVAFTGESAADDL
jgi:hypothetical protein